MRCAELLLAGPAADRQIAALSALARARGLAVQHIHADGPEPTTLTVGTTTLQVAEKELSADAVLYTHGLRYDVPALPPLDVLDPSLFQDRHVAAQQRASLLWSFLSAAEAALRPGCMVNAWSRANDIPTAFSALRRLQAAGLPVPPLLLTSSLRTLRASSAHGSGTAILWAFPDHGVPLRPLRRKRWPELFRGNDLPLLILPPRTGDPLRAWVLQGQVVLAARVQEPAYDVALRHLERFTYLPDDAALARIAGQAQALLGLDFFELHLRATDAGLEVEGLAPDPELMALPARARDYLLGALLSRLAALAGLELETPTPPAGEEARDAVYLTRLLEGPMRLAGP